MIDALSSIRYSESLPRRDQLSKLFSQGKREVGQGKTSTIIHNVPVTPVRPLVEAVARISLKNSLSQFHDTSGLLEDLPFSPA